MKNKVLRVLIYLGLILLAFVLVRGCRDNKNLKNKINAIETINDSIRNSIAGKNKRIETLNQELGHHKLEIDSLTNLKNKVSVQRIEVEKPAETMTLSQLDSIINRTPKKLAVKYILGYPVVSRELDLANSLIDGYKISVYTLQQRDALRLSIIQDKDLQIENTEKQRDLYKKASSPKSGLFLYGEFSVNPIFEHAAIGLDYQIRNTLLLGASGSYNNAAKHAYFNVKAGVIIF